MGSKFKKSLVSENVRESLHGWCKRVKHRSRHKHSSYLPATRSTCSLASTLDEGDDETITVLSGTLSRCATTTTLRSLSFNHVRDDETITVSGTISRCPSTASQRSFSLNHVSINCEEIYADDVIQQQEICDDDIVHQQERGTVFPTSGYLSDSSGNAPVVASHESDVDNANIDDNYDDNREQH
ncbi:MLO-like protein 4 [Nymphaea thermarum]|nr:MLO-like protein 4 [Nymphaea thermarum]